jgi:hypothetical protein
LSKLPKHVPCVEFADLKIGGAAECDGACMAKGFPKRLRALDRSGGTRAFNRFTGDNAAIDVIARHDHEMGDLRHGSASSLAPDRADAVTGGALGQFFLFSCQPNGEGGFSF